MVIECHCFGLNVIIFGESVTTGVTVMGAAVMAEEGDRARTVGGSDPPERVW